MRKQINIEGMSCSHCVRHVEEALKELNGVLNVVVELKGKHAVVESDREITDSEFKNAIEEAGYEVISVVSL